MIRTLRKRTSRLCCTTPPPPLQESRFAAPPCASCPYPEGPAERTLPAERKLGRGVTGSGEMAAAFADYSPEQGLERKREFVIATIAEALDHVLNELLPHATIPPIDLTCSRDGIVFEGKVTQTATDDDWNRVLSEGLAVKFNVDWSDPKECFGRPAGASTPGNNLQHHEVRGTQP